MKIYCDLFVIGVLTSYYVQTYCDWCLNFHMFKHIVQLNCINICFVLINFHSIVASLKQVPTSLINRLIYVHE